MERIAELLDSWSVQAGEHRTWKLERNSLILRVDARSDEQFESAAEAFAEAQRFVERLVDKRWVLANRVEISAQCEPLNWGEESRWFAVVSLVMSDPELIATDGMMTAVSL